jgi:hypothetical protein
MVLFTEFSRVRLLTIFSSQTTYNFQQSDTYNFQQSDYLQFTLKFLKQFILSNLLYKDVDGTVNKQI